jgi:hypothetical protein
MTGKQKSAQVRKEALLLLYQSSWDALRPLLSTCAFEEYNQRSQLVWDAYMQLIPAIYGPRKPGQCPFPCDGCRERYADHFVHEKGTHKTIWGCIPCLNRLRAEGKLEEEVQP